MPKQITVQCPEKPADIIIAALQWFVQSHYPHAADECSAAAREALLDLVDRFRQELRVGGRSAYSARVRAFVCEAVKGYTALLEQDSGEAYGNRREVLIAICRGQSDGGAYAEAEALDRRAAPTGGRQ